MLFLLHSARFGAVADRRRAPPSDSDDKADQEAPGQSERRAQRSRGPHDEHAPFRLQVSPTHLGTLRHRADDLALAAEIGRRPVEAHPRTSSTLGILPNDVRNSGSVRLRLKRTATCHK
jgi:hypothetical protein